MGITHLAMRPGSLTNHFSHLKCFLLGTPIVKLLHFFFSLSFPGANKLSHLSHSSFDIYKPLRKQSHSQNHYSVKSLEVNLRDPLPDAQIKEVCHLSNARQTVGGKRRYENILYLTQRRETKTDSWSVRTDPRREKISSMASWTDSLSM